MNKFSRRWIAADALSVFEINVALARVGCGIGFAKFDVSLLQCRIILYLPSFHPSKALGAVRVARLSPRFFFISGLSDPDAVSRNYAS